jgi:glycosyltransferase involved in cell wall biosynthesis
LLVADSPADFARTTIALLGDAARRADLGAAARARVSERYAWPVVGDQLMAAYDQAMVHHSRR